MVEPNQPKLDGKNDARELVELNIRNKAMVTFFTYYMYSKYIIHIEVLCRTKAVCRSTLVTLWTLCTRGHTQ